MNVLLFEDERVGQLAPVTIGRPAYAIACGSFRLIELVREFGPMRRLVRPHLRGVETADSLDEMLADGPLDGPTLLVSARLVPSMPAVAQLRALIATDREGIVASGESVAAALLKRRLEIPQFADGAALPAMVRKLSLPSVAAELPLFDYPHDILRHHLQTIRDNLQHRIRTGYREVADGLFVAEGVTLGEHLVTDTRGGPIVIDNGASLGPFCYLKGPIYMAPGSRLNEHSALKDGVTLGERAKVGGEVEASIIEQFSNKQHHGFLGHSYIGSWVNLGAGTSNSDLKNTYGQVNMDYAGRKTPTGMQFVGCFIGDYSKTAVNTSIFTGKTIGACSMVYGFVTTNVPSFTNYARSFSQVTESPAAVAISAQARMFTRRGITQRPCDAQLLRDMFELTRTERANYGEPLPTEPLSL
jgi:UDP-N-acetylglucosamine diphosphorylase / glucose-1-phosphate thymidylyltransferase / UDP-N-acetylgalactosamine diphosphorylase / glucosamine-1-phosphate N-acetyltransferase / galactosamine-1-phosphate N-acetyltransferase